MVLLRPLDKTSAMMVSRKSFCKPAVTFRCIYTSCRTSAELLRGWCWKYLFIVSMCSMTSWALSFIADSLNPLQPSSSFLHLTDTDRHLMMVIMAWSWVLWRRQRHRQKQLIRKTNTVFLVRMTTGNQRLILRRGKCKIFISRDLHPPSKLN